MRGRDRLFGAHSIHSYKTHQAAKTGNICELKRLFQSTDENPLLQDYNKKTPLHYAVNFGNPKIAHKMVLIILNSKYLTDKLEENEDDNTCQVLINMHDENGETALHLAAKNANRRAVEELITYGADVNLKCNDKIEAIELVYSIAPQAMLSIFDTAISSSKCLELQEDHFEVEIDFTSITGQPMDGDSTLFMEMKLLKYALRSSPSKYKELIVHPLVQLFLHYKWEKIRFLFWGSILFHIAWLLVYTHFSLNLYLEKCPYIIPKKSDETETDDREKDLSSKSLPDIPCPIGAVDIPLAWLLTSASLLTLSKEVYEFWNSPTCMFYFKQLENIGQLLVIGSALLNSWPVLEYGLLQVQVRSTIKVILIRPWSYQVAAYGVFLAWALILLQIGKIPQLGTYVEILVKVLKSFVLFIVTFISLLTAFALSFSILMPENQTFRSIPTALSKVLVMMTGELNYDEIFYSEEETSLPFYFSGQLFFATFVIMVTIILFNLLIGFTVSDIQGLQATATISRLRNQLEQIHLMEAFLYSKGVGWLMTLFRMNKERWLRRFMIGSVVSQDDVEDLGASDDPEFSAILTKRAKDIPKDLQSKVKELAIKNLEGSLELEETNQEKAKSSNAPLSDEELRRIIQIAVQEALASTCVNNQDAL